jgi:tetratricopeptide (TPR) repeat protein
MTDLGREDLRIAILEGRPGAIEQLRAAVSARRQERGGHLEWARLCEEAGEASLAISEYQLALRDDPASAEALARLSVLHEERGDVRAAISCAAMWAESAPTDSRAAERFVDLLVADEQVQRAREFLAKATELPGDVREVLEARVEASAREEPDGEVEEEPSVDFTESDVVRFVHLFSGRENVYARQWAAPGGEGGYSPVREPFTVQVARNHLLGSITVGIYPLRLDDTVCFFALDVDITKRGLRKARGSLSEARRLKDLVSQEARRLQAELEGLGIPSLLEDSGYKGRHVWVFLERPEPAAVVRNFGQLFLAAVRPASPDLAVEFFPKQSRAGTGVGNLIKLPLGIHRRTGRRSRLLRPDGSVESDPHGALRRQAKLSRERLHGAIAALKERVAGVEAIESIARLGEQDSEEGPSRPAGPVDPGAFTPPPPSWTRADFDVHPEISTILKGCSVLSALVSKADRHRRLTHEEQVVLRHSLGHSAAGVLAVNYLFDLCADVPVQSRLQSPLAGNPISCPKIRKRIPHITGSVPCNCTFEFARDQYPTPRLHLLRPSSGFSVEGVRGRTEPKAEWKPEDRVRSLRALRVRQRELENEIARAEAELMEYLEKSGVGEIALEDGTLRVVQEEGQAPALVWEARPRAEAIDSPSGEQGHGDSDADGAGVDARRGR